MRPRYCRSADSRIRMQNALLLLRGAHDNNASLDLKDVNLLDFLALQAL